jgi:hypothetical protein
VDTLGPYYATARTHRAFTNFHEERLTYLRRFKFKIKLLSGEERIAERLIYFRFFDTMVGERSTNGVNGLLAFSKTSSSK